MTEPTSTVSLEAAATAYAAPVATLAFGLEIRRWRKEAPRLGVSLVPDGAVVGGGPNDEKNLLIIYVVVRSGGAYHVGELVPVRVRNWLEPAATKTEALLHSAQSATQGLRA